MSENDGFKYRIEFETDEESLVNSIDDAILSARPQIFRGLRYTIEEAFGQIIKEVTAELEPIRLDVDIIEHRESIERIRSETSPVPQFTERTVFNMVEDTANLLEDPNLNIDSMVRSAINILISRFTDAFRDLSPQQSKTLLEAPVQEIAVQSSRYGGIGDIVTAIDSLAKRYESTGTVGRMSDSLKTMLTSILGSSQMDVVKEQISTGDDKTEVMTIRRLMQVMGLSPDEDDYDIQEILRTEIAVALREGGVTIGLHRAVVTPEEREKLDTIADYIKDNIQPFITSMISSKRARLGDEYDVDLRRKTDFEIKKFGTVTDFRSGIEEIKDSAKINEFMPDVVDRIPPSTEPVDMSKVTEALNRLISVLYRIGQDDVAMDAESVLSDAGLLGDALRHHRSGDYG